MMRYINDKIPYQLHNIVASFVDFALKIYAELTHSYATMFEMKMYTPQSNKRNVGRKHFGGLPSNLSR